jgi:Resolvase, N terminal domain
MIRCGEADVLVVWKLDRCSRSVHDFSVLLEELRSEDAGFVSCTESFDTSDPIGEATVQITMVFAQLERARSSQRALAWHAHRASRGDPFLGRPPFGYVRARDGHGRPAGPLEIDETTAPVVRRAAELFLATASMGEVRRFLGEHGYERWTQSLRKGLASQQLAGIRIVDGVPITGSWPAILDVETHFAIVAKLNEPERGRGRPAGERWLLSGFLVCGDCGRSMLAGGHHQVKAKGGVVKRQRHYRDAADPATCRPVARAGPAATAGPGDISVLPHRRRGAMAHLHRRAARALREHRGPRLTHRDVRQPGGRRRGGRPPRPVRRPLAAVRAAGGPALLVPPSEALAPRTALARRMIGSTQRRHGSAAEVAVESAR